MKITIDSRLYAVRNIKSGELLARYTGGYFWTRKGDAINKLLQVKDGYELLTVGLNVEEVIDGVQYREELRKQALAKQIKELERSKKIKELKSQLTELTGFNDIPTIQKFIGNTMLVPDYKLKIENIIQEIKNL